MASDFERVCQAAEQMTEDGSLPNLVLIGQIRAPSPPAWRRQRSRSTPYRNLTDGVRHSVLFEVSGAVETAFAGATSSTRRRSRTLVPPDSNHANRRGGPRSRACGRGCRKTQETSSRRDRGRLPGGRQVWVGLYKTRADMMQTKCGAASLSTANPRTRPQGQGREGQDPALSLLTGTNRTKKGRGLCDTVSKAADPLEKWSRWSRRWRSWWTIPAVRRTSRRCADAADHRGFTDNDLDRLAPKITPEWGRLSPNSRTSRFQYRQAIGHYIQLRRIGRPAGACACSSTRQGACSSTSRRDLDNQVIWRSLEITGGEEGGRSCGSHNPNIVVSSVPTSSSAPLPHGRRPSGGRIMLRGD